MLMYGSKYFDPFRLFKILLHRVIHSMARKNHAKYPQVAIYSFDHIGLTINLEGRYESHALQAIGEFISMRIPNAEKKVALDIGANIGNHSLFLSELFEKIYSFEPNPYAFRLLEINADYQARKKNIITCNFGLSDCDKTLHFLAASLNIGGSHIIDAKENTGEHKKIEISVKQGDKLSLLDNQSIALIKIDVEGHELPALKGCRGLIEKNKPIILFEQSMLEINDGTSPVIEYLKELNYTFAVLERNFNFGEKFLQKAIAFLFRSVFGFGLNIAVKERFDKKFYEMIIAIPKSS
jgi:FkbM family methyltransferase